MDNKNFTKITLEQPDLKVIWEVPYEDVNGKDIMNAIRTIMVGMTFSEKSVYDSMADYLKEKAFDLYEIIELSLLDKPDYIKLSNKNFE